MSNASLKLLNPVSGVFSGLMWFRLRNTNPAACSAAATLAILATVSAAPKLLNAVEIYRADRIEDVGSIDLGPGREVRSFEIPEEYLETEWFMRLGPKSFTPDQSILTVWSTWGVGTRGDRWDVRTGDYLGRTPWRYHFHYGITEGQPLYNAQIDGSSGTDVVLQQTATAPHHSISERIDAPSGGADLLATEVYANTDNFGSIRVPTYDVLFDSQTGLVRQVFDKVVSFGPGPLGPQSRLYELSGDSMNVYEEKYTDATTYFDLVNTYLVEVDPYYSFHLGPDNAIYYVQETLDEFGNEIQGQRTIRHFDALTGADLGVFAEQPQFDPLSHLDGFTSIRFSRDGLLYVQHGFEIPGNAFTWFDPATGEKLGGWADEWPRNPYYSTDWEPLVSVPEPSGLALLALGMMAGQLRCRRL
ncbi:hypothetical protein KOR34_18390 [Posidoniimonas corsicana]|uniref:Ice-binding protein C-terminal domain-containing protein n=1 Tax=Posidoniimonas corsicana TaxID=1938618 RepID=A0A5C5VE52_9BACT|nr:PEP-CTERM sorting domain-containing protein [Posidoniimonas corsicana]TWT36894.1 hypothetical protein KOR34_18390 [Posidoniimonas corsicana]